MSALVKWYKFEINSIFCGLLSVKDRWQRKQPDGHVKIGCKNSVKKYT